MGWRRPPNRLNSYNAPESQRVDAAGEWRKKDMILTWEGLTDKAAAKQQGYAGTPTHCRIQRHHCNLMSGQSAGVTLDARQFECRVTTR